MRIAVVFPAHPFAVGGGEKMADDLIYNLNKYGHKAKRYYSIYDGYKLRSCIRGTLCSNSLFFDDDVDMVIPLTTSDVGIKHNNVVPWLISQQKCLYDMFFQETGCCNFGSEGDVLREITINIDSTNLQKLSRVYTISPRVKELIFEYNKINAEVLVLPIENNKRFLCKDYGNFILYHSRLHRQKRQHLAIEAMSYTKTPVKLVVAGADNYTDYVESLKKLIEANDLSDKVKLIVGCFTDEQKISWLSECLGGFYLGENEDYWAIVTTELMMSKKPVIAPIDTGATSYVVQDGITGFQPEGTPKAIAEAMDRLYLDKKAAQRMGEAGDELIRKVTPSWKTVVHTLTGEI